MSEKLCALRKIGGGTVKATLVYTLTVGAQWKTYTCDENCLGFSWLINGVKQFSIVTKTALPTYSPTSYISIGKTANNNAINVARNGDTIYISISNADPTQVECYSMSDTELSKIFD